MAAVGCEPTPPVLVASPAAWVAEEAPPAAAFEALVAMLDAPETAEEAAPCALETTPPAFDETDPATPDAPVWAAVTALPTALLSADARPDGLLAEARAWRELTNAGLVGMPARAEFVRKDAIAGLESAVPRLAMFEEASPTMELRPEGTRLVTSPPTADWMAEPAIFPAAD